MQTMKLQIFVPKRFQKISRISVYFIIVSIFEVLDHNSQNKEWF